MEQIDEIYQNYKKELELLEEQKEQNQKNRKQMEEVYEVIFYERNKSFHIMEDLTAQWGNCNDTYRFRESYSETAKFIQNCYITEKEMLENEYKSILQKREDFETEYLEETRKLDGKEEE